MRKLDEKLKSLVGQYPRSFIAVLFTTGALVGLVVHLLMLEINY